LFEVSPTNAIAVGSKKRMGFEGDLYGIEENAIKWDSVTAYSLGDYVTYNNWVWKAKVATDAGDEPGNSSKWVYAEKFKDNSCYEKLWCEGRLRKVLALSGAKWGARGIRVKITKAGVVGFESSDDQGMVRVSDKSFSGRLDQMDSLIQSNLTMMERWIDAYAEADRAACFDEYLRYKTDEELKAQEAEEECEEAKEQEDVPGGIWM
jgi:hypothetical protein